MAARDPGSHFVVFTQSGKISVGYPGSHFGVFTQSGKISVGYPGSHFGVFTQSGKISVAIFFRNFIHEENVVFVSWCLIHR